MDLGRIYVLPNIIKMQINFSLVGIFFYFTNIILFLFYYNCIVFIKEEIFSFIFLKSITFLIELFIDNHIYKYLFKYCSQVIVFSLLLLHINKCLTQKKIIENIKDLEINDKIYIMLIYMLSFFPYEFMFDLQFFERVLQLVIKMVLAIYFYSYVDKKIKIMLDRLREQQIKSKNEINYLMGCKENYYLKMLRTINSMYLTALILYICTMLIYISLLYNFNEFVKIVGKFCFFSAFSIVILAQLLFFFCSNKIELEKAFRKGKLNSGIKKFMIIKIFNQGDFDENNVFP
jgi:hypothetical protein